LLINTKGYTMAIDLQDLFEMEMPEKSGGMIRTTEQKMSSHQVFLDEEIGNPSKYRDLINTLYMCGSDDQVNMFINSPGGSLSAAMAIIEGIKGCDGVVRGIITGECHSAASMIMLNCHEIIVTDSAHMMCHTASYGTGGSTHVVQKHVDFSTGHINKILKDTYEGFLTDAEFSDLIKGIEFWFDADAIKARLDTRMKFIEKRVKAQEAAEKPPVKKKTVKKVS
jgi:ATP-dependent protease ClpP protease subunit